MIQNQLEDFRSSNFIPDSLTGFEQISDFHTSRYQSSVDWIDQYGHAVISNGPFYLQGYSPDSRSITIKSFDSSGYPLEQGIWKEFEYAKYPIIESVIINELIQKGTELDIPIETKNSTKLHYFISNSQGEIITSGIKDVLNNNTRIVLEKEDTENLPNGPLTLKIFAASDNVLKPYEFSTSFLVVDSDSSLSKSVISDNLVGAQDDDYTAIIVIIILAIIGSSIVVVKKRMK